MRDWEAERCGALSCRARRHQPRGDVARRPRRHPWAGARGGCEARCGLLSSRAAALVLHGLPLQLYDLEREVVAAFRSLQGGSNIGQGGGARLDDRADVAERRPT